MLIYIDTNAAYAGNWLAKFYESTLNNSYLLENTLILITFDEVQVTKDYQKHLLNKSFLDSKLFF